MGYRGFKGIGQRDMEKLYGGPRPASAMSECNPDWKWIPDWICDPPPQGIVDTKLQMQYPSKEFEPLTSVEMQTATAICKELPEELRAYNRGDADYSKATLFRDFVYQRFPQTKPEPSQVFPTTPSPLTTLKQVAGLSPTTRNRFWGEFCRAIETEYPAPPSYPRLQWAMERLPDLPAALQVAWDRIHNLL